MRERTARPTSTGNIELGFGLGEPHRGRRYAAELVPALARTLLAPPDVRRFVARERAPRSSSSARSAASRGTRSLSKPRVLLGGSPPAQTKGLSKVERIGIEPMTSGLQSRRSPS